MSNDVGIDRLKPQYDKSMIVPEDTAYWEVLYDDGTVLSEAQGAVYPQIDRGRLASFRIVYSGEIVFELYPKEGHTGHDLIYRRRTSLGQSGMGRSVVFIVGLAPLGPFFVVDLANGQYYEDPSVIASLGHMPGEPSDLMPHWTALPTTSS